MKTTIRYIMITTALMVGFTSGGALQAQTTGEEARSGRPVLSVPIQVVGAQIREVPSIFMHKLGKDEESRPVEVLDLSVEVRSRALETLPPSLQPFLHIGGKAYPVQRVEYSNWDARNEKPIDKNAPVGETQTIHFFIEDWPELDERQPMVLSILTPQEMKQMTKGRYTADEFNRIMPELKQQIPSYAPQEFMNIGR